MRKLLVIGIGAGSPEYVTVQAIDALNRARVFFVFDKGEAKGDLVALRKEICERFIANDDYRFVSIDDPVRDPERAGYKRGVETWHRERAEKLAERIATEVADGECGAFLVWGDPSLYDSTLRLIDLVREEDRFAFEIEVVPGISSVQALAARHGLILNTIGGSVLVTTGRELAERGWPEAADSVVVMLDRGDGLRAACEDGVDVYWGALLGTPRERLVSGKLTDVIDEIERIRKEEKARSGWIMDIYLLRRSQPA